MKRLRVLVNKRLCISLKRASIPRPFRTIRDRRTAYKNILRKCKTCYGVVKVQKAPGCVTPQNPCCLAVDAGQPRQHGGLRYTTKSVLPRSTPTTSRDM